jgi:hypothetical protein
MALIRQFGLGQIAGLDPASEVSRKSLGFGSSIGIAGVVRQPGRHVRGGFGVAQPPAEGTLGPHAE